MLPLHGMKRIFALPLLSLYLFFSGSRVLSFHYCGGTLAETRINAQASCCCDDAPMSANNDCCEDTVKPVKHPDASLTDASKFVDAPSFKLIPNPNYAFHHNPSVLYAASLITPEKYQPPDKQRPLAAYIQYHALLLYA